jgi:hypothetical protein
MYPTAPGTGSAGGTNAKAVTHVAGVTFELARVRDRVLVMEEQARVHAQRLLGSRARDPQPAQSPLNSKAPQPPLDGEIEQLRDVLLGLVRAIDELDMQLRQLQEL